MHTFILVLQFLTMNTARKMKFPFKDVFSKSDQIRSYSVTFTEKNPPHFFVQRKISDPLLHNELRFSIFGMINNILLLFLFLS